MRDFTMEEKSIIFTGLLMESNQLADDMKKQLDEINQGKATTLSLIPYTRQLQIRKELIELFKV